MQQAPTVPGRQGIRWRCRASKLLLAGISPVIPPKSNRREPIPCDFRAYKDRNRIERMFNKVKQFRRIAARYDKTKVTGRLLPRRLGLDAGNDVGI
ncbi:transposase [Roseibium sp.]|uniref:transposase n=1 Tax=Roseibium sp. TaxID=1936156 RepID=UPI00326D4C69